VLDHRAPVEHLHLPIISSKVRNPMAAISSRTSSAMKEEEIDHMLGLAWKALAQHRVLRGDARPGRY